MKSIQSYRLEIFIKWCFEKSKWIDQMYYNKHQFKSMWEYQTLLLQSCKVYQFHSDEWVVDFAWEGYSKSTQYNVEYTENGNLSNESEW